MSYVKHIVLLKKKPETSVEADQLFIKSVRAFASIPGVVDVSVGSQTDDLYQGYTDRARDYTHALVVTLDSPESLLSYQDHPLHQEAAENHIRPNFILPETIAIDFLQPKPIQE